MQQAARALLQYMRPRIQTAVTVHCKDVVGREVPHSLLEEAMFTLPTEDPLRPSCSAPPPLLLQMCHLTGAAASQVDGHKTDHQVQEYQVDHIHYCSDTPTTG